ncbi:MAG TPA: transketolase [Thermoanaerobaculia bacterium]|nr:transketolase [Thermoanaerobaculia bacterium]
MSPTPHATSDAESERLAAGSDHLAINTLRFLAVDMVEKAQSGHPGAPMGQAPMAFWLWTRHLRHDPAHPRWLDRDRFVLSSGHASALLYGLLHLAGYPMPMAELRAFRQLRSKTPGHPEHDPDLGIETTTGPLGQGLANAVGMAIAERVLAARFNRDGFPVFDHRTWVIASDGDLMEGVTAEACSLAGHLRLGKLCVLYDSNGISIDGPTTLTFSEDVAARFAAYGWHVADVEDGNDLAALDAAMAAAKADPRPSLVVVRTHIGFGSPTKQGTAEAHGAPLGSDEAAAAKRALGWPEEPTFHVPQEAREPFAEAAARGAAEHAAWKELFARYADVHPTLAAELLERLSGELPAGWADALPRFEPGTKLATRQASGKVINALAPVLPQLVGGSADLSGSNSTLVDGEDDFSALAWGGRNLRFGVREHAMGSILNGLALNRLLLPYGGTFLVFADYMRPPIRLAALMRLRVVFVFTHDSIFLGEDGPTHQPEAHLASLRAMPNLVVLRPADANETAAAWKVAIERHDGPTVLALSRQKLPVLAGTRELAIDGVARGAYVVADPADGAAPALALIGTGSEVATCVAAAELLAGAGIPARVVSMPSWELFAAQPAEVRETVLPAAIERRLAVEAAATFGWERWVGPRGAVVGVDRYGESAPAEDLARHFGFTPEAVAERARRLVEGE